MRLSDDEVATFLGHGHVVRRGVFSAIEVAAVRAAFERLYDVAQHKKTTGDHDGAYFVLDDRGAGGVVVKRIVWAGGAEPLLLALSADRRLVEPALQLLSSASCEQLLCQAHFKMPGDGVSFDWHQDIQHRDKGPGTWRDVNGRGSYVQSLLLVDDMRVDNGPLLFLPATAALLDARGRLVQGADTALPMPASAGAGDYGGGGVVVDESQAITVTGEAGDVIFFDPYAVHGSRANTSTTSRRVLINGYAAPGANGRVYPGRGAGRVLTAA
jgi:ectoine hydroxylase-related dioxygenase (phytanoyl-CoA dioxygenase family)